MKNIKVGVLLGGKSKERPGSLKTGKTVIDSLQSQNYDVLPIDPIEENLIDKLKSVDCVFNALHGWYGEDGKIQGLMEILGIKYTGSGVLASAIGMNKVIFKKLIITENIPTPPFVEIDGHDIKSEIKKIVDTLGLPIVIKPIEEGGSLGISIINDLTSFSDTIISTTHVYNNLFVEKYIKGKFLTVGLLGKYKEPKLLPVMKITYNSEFYDYEVKHTQGAAQYNVPADIPPEIYKKTQDYAQRIYILLGCHGPLRVDFIYGDDQEVYVLEVNTIPGLSPIGNLPAIAAAAGITYDDLINEILSSAFNKPTFLP